MNRYWVVVALVTLVSLKPTPAFAQLKVTEASSVSVQWPKHANTNTTPLRVLAPDGRLAASTEELPNAKGITHVRLFDGRTGKELDTQRVHVGGVRCMAFSPDGTQLATGGLTDGTVKVWDLKTLKQSAVFRGFYSPYALAFSPDGKTLATAGRSVAQGLPDPDLGAVRLWDIGSGKERANLLGSKVGYVPDHLRFSPNGKRLMVLWSGTCDVWDMDRERLVLEMKSDKPHTGLFTSQPLFGSGWKYLVTGSSHFEGDGKHSYKLHLFDGETGKEKWAVESKGGEWPFAFSPDGTFVAVNTSGGVNVIETETGKTAATLKGVTVPYGRFSADGKTLTGLVENNDKETVIKTWELTWEKRPGK